MNEDTPTMNPPAPEPISLADHKASKKPVPAWFQDLPDWLVPVPSWVTEVLRPMNQAGLAQLAELYGVGWEAAVNVAVSDGRDAKLANYNEAIEVPE